MTRDEVKTFAWAAVVGLVWLVLFYGWFLQWRRRLICRLIGHRFGGWPKSDVPGAALPMAFCSRCGRLL